MRQQILARTAILCVALVSLAGCDDVRSALGLDRHVPDETQVVSHPGLTLPPDYDLRPPGTATPVSAEHESGTKMGQPTGTAGEQALEKSAAAATPKKEEKGFFGRMFGWMNPFSDDSEAEATQPAQPQSANQKQESEPEPTPEQSINGTPVPSK